MNVRRILEGVVERFFVVHVSLFFKDNVTVLLKAWILLVLVYPDDECKENIFIPKISLLVQDNEE
jgi:hypothetical protein